MCEHCGHYESVHAHGLNPKARGCTVAWCKCPVFIRVKELHG